MSTRHICTEKFNGIQHECSIIHSCILELQWLLDLLDLAWDSLDSLFVETNFTKFPTSAFVHIQRPNTLNFIRVHKTS